MLRDRITIYSRKLIKDERGWFVKIIDGKEKSLPQFSREIYVTSAKPGESKGGDYSLNTNKWFSIISGKALLVLEDIDSKEHIELKLEENNPQTVFVPRRIANKFYNLGEEDFILIAYADNIYDENDIIPYQIW